MLKLDPPSDEMCARLLEYLDDYYHHRDENGLSKTVTLFCLFYNIKEPEVKIVDKRMKDSVAEYITGNKRVKIMKRDMYISEEQFIKSVIHELMLHHYVEEKDEDFAKEAESVIYNKGKRL